MTIPLFRPAAVLFDLFDTLVPAMTTQEVFPPTWEDLGIPIELYQRRWFQNSDGRASGRIRDPLEVLRVVAHDIDPNIPMERIEWATARRLQRFEHVLTHVDPATVDAVVRLRAAGVRTALVSNACFGEIEAWPRSPFAAHFDTAVFSCHVGVVKPERAIYEEALRRVGVAASAAIFAGDGGSDELGGARAAGLATALISGITRRHWNHALPARRAQADWEFESVVELVNALVPAAAGPGR